ncbi:MAG: cytochrome P450 [Chloroflexi bacterium]|nr:MAG: cytochrome P450 [Chloroflexota bacterium]
MPTRHTSVPSTLPTYDLFGPRFKAQAYTVYAQMRQEMPVYRRANAGGAGATCFITTYDEAVAVLRDARRFVKDVRNTMTPAERAALPDQPPLLRLLSNHMLNLDPPDHTRLRGLVNKAFTARMVDQLQGRVEAVAHELLDRIQPQGQADLIDAFALPLPIIVIADLLGIPTRDRNRFRTWSNALVAPSADEARNAKKLAKSRQLMQDFIDYLRAVFAARRSRPCDDLVTSLLHAEEAGDVLSEEELFSMILLLVVVGHETTVNLIGNGTLALLQHPAAAAQLRGDPALLPLAIEEMLRYDSPVERAPMRFAAEDVQLREVLIRRGDAVSVVLGSANRDETAFPAAETFDIRRDPNRHLSFGLGIHYCLGAPLARLEGRVALAALLDRLPNLELAVAPESLRWRTHPIMRGVQRLPVRWSGG